jgi:HPt (histidine-containing phosphotransfer) domain-containing protein
MSEMRRDDDVKALEILAHTVKGIASNISAVALHECCQRIETAAKGGDIKSARKLLPELERTVAATMEAIQGSPY